MKQTLQTIVAFLMIVLAVVAVAVWFNNRSSGQLLWILRITCPVIAIALLVVLIQMMQKPDLVPDYLAMNFGSCFEQNGLLFHIKPEQKENDTLWLAIYFENKYENACDVTIELYPKQPPRLRSISAKFTCDPAAFGVATVPMILDSATRDQKSTWEVSATVHYPRGKRSQLRFRNGKEVCTNAERRKPRFHIFQIPVLLLGIFNWKIVQTLSFYIPRYVNSDFAMNQITHTKTLWKLGDPPLT